MDTTSIGTIAEVLSATSPYGILVCLGWAFWRLSERKDRDIKAMHEKMVSIAEQNTAAVTKVEAALVGLTKAIERLQ